VQPLLLQNSSTEAACCLKSYVARTQILDRFCLIDLVGEAWNDDVWLQSTASVLAIQSASTAAARPWHFNHSTGSFC
jgi:hypothetical protein